MRKTWKAKVMNSMKKAQKMRWKGTSPEYRRNFMKKIRTAKKDSPNTVAKELFGKENPVRGKRPDGATFNPVARRWEREGGEPINLNVLAPAPATPAADSTHVEALKREIDQLGELLRKAQSEASTFKNLAETLTKKLNDLFWLVGEARDARVF